MFDKYKKNLVPRKCFPDHDIDIEQNVMLENNAL